MVLQEILPWFKLCIVVCAISCWSLKLHYIISKRCHSQTTLMPKNNKWIVLVWYSKINNLCILDFTFFYSWAVFAWDITPSIYNALYYAQEALCVLPTHRDTGVWATLCTLHGISNVIEAAWEYRFINSKRSKFSYTSACYMCIVCLIVLLEHLSYCINRICIVISIFCSCKHLHQILSWADLSRFNLANQLCTYLQCTGCILVKVSKINSMFINFVFMYYQNIVLFIVLYIH